MASEQKISDSTKLALKSRIQLRLKEGRVRMSDWFKVRLVAEFDRSLILRRLPRLREAALTCSPPFKLDHFRRALTKSATSELP